MPITKSLGRLPKDGRRNSIARGKAESIMVLKSYCGKYVLGVRPSTIFFKWQWNI